MSEVFLKEKSRQLKCSVCDCDDFYVETMETRGVTWYLDDYNYSVTRLVCKECTNILLFRDKDKLRTIED